MAKKRFKGPREHSFRNKLLLNQWLISLFGIDPLGDNRLHGQKVRPFRRLADPISDPRLEGLDSDRLHHFYHALVNSNLFWDDTCLLSKEKILQYETNIVGHTQQINEKRARPVVWKYYQWLTLLFVEIYLDRYFDDRARLMVDLNEYVDRFNRHWPEFADVPHYNEDDLNKVCLQSATGSGKTLLMHVNLLQYRYYAERHRKDKELSRVILLTPNERLSEQHLNEFGDSGLEAYLYMNNKDGLFSGASGLDRVDVLEITKLADHDGPNTIATRSLGDQNLLLVDEGHRGMSGKEEGVWFTRRGELCAKGFTFEYSATFEQAIRASKDKVFENTYAKTIIFDYSYRWFYEDGFGKDYQILNLPESFEEVRANYLTACLLKFYQQLRIYEENYQDFKPFNLEKPLWVFVGSTVSSAKGVKDEKIVATDVARIIEFIAGFLDDRAAAYRRIKDILLGGGHDTGLLDEDGNDIFAGSFSYIAKKMNAGDTVETLYTDILKRLFNNSAGGILLLERVKGESGEIVLRSGRTETPFGLINVGDAKGLSDHVSDLAAQNGVNLKVEDSDFSEVMFASVRESASPVNLLIGSKKFVEGWDCWRVSTMGLMHVGSTEGSQIIQLFGRGVRLKGYNWSLKRSGHTDVASRPNFIEELETLNVFGIKADFMEKFRDFLKEEGLPGNESKELITIKLNATYDFGKKLKILRPKRKADDGREYDFKKDGPVPMIGEIPEYLQKNTVTADWYPRIQAMQSRKTGQATEKDKVSFAGKHLALLDYDYLFFELEQFKRERSWHNLNITKEGIKQLMADNTWYTLYMPKSRLAPTGYAGVLLLQQVASELLKRYCDHYYNYCKRRYIEPRLELRELNLDEGFLPTEEEYRIIVDGNEEQLISSINKIKEDIEKNKEELLEVGSLNFCSFNRHLYQPLFHVRPGAKIKVLPVDLNQSEFQFVTDLKKWSDKKKDFLESKGIELFLLRNLSRGKGVGFFEAGNFHPDFIMWLIAGERQYVTFLEPHGLIYEGPGSEKILFYQSIKDVEKRLNDRNITLNSFILSWSKHPTLKWGLSLRELEEKHVLFMKDDQDGYIDKLFSRLGFD